MNALSAYEDGFKVASVDFLFAIDDVIMVVGLILILFTGELVWGGLLFITGLVTHLSGF